MADQLGNRIIFVNDEPYCIWGWDLDERNKQFVDGLDPDYFDFLIRAFLETDDDKRSAIALRTTLHHSLETLFSLMGALTQAPQCTYAWLAKCSTTALRAVIDRVSTGDKTLRTGWTFSSVSWHQIAMLVFKHSGSDVPTVEKRVQLFAELWHRLAHEFLEDDHVQEYNAIKHGLRLHAGGFTLAAGLEPSYGVAPPPEHIQTIGHSKYGSSFFRMERIGDEKSRSLSSRRVSLNWPVEKVILLAQLTSMSIQNVIGALRIANGAAAGTVRFYWPSDDADFDRPWTYSTGVTNLSIDLVIPKEQIPALTKQELLDHLAQQNKIGGRPT